MKSTGERICEARKQKGLSQEELAHQAKINIRTLQRIESGKSQPRGYTLQLLCEALGVNLEELIDFGKKEDNSFMALFHLSVISYLVIPFGNVIFPLFLWMSNKRKIKNLQNIGARLINFQILYSMFLFLLVIISTWLKINHYRGGSTGLTLVFFLYGANLIYALTTTLMIRSGKIRSYYPSIIRFV